jgi:hypothetical protein
MLFGFAIEAAKKSSTKLLSINGANATEAK